MLRLLITLPFLVALIIFAFQNQEIVTLFWPGGNSRPTSLAVLMIAVAVIFFLLGCVTVWFSELRQRRRARRAEQSMRGLETQISELRLQLAQAVTENHLNQQVAGQPTRPYVLQSPPPPAS